MGKYLAPVKPRAHDDANNAPHWPRDCSVTDCVDDDVLRRTKKKQPCATAVAIAIVDDAEGRRRSGAFTAFGETDYRMKSGFSFVRWVTRCAACYALDMERASKAQLSRADMVPPS